MANDIHSAITEAIDSKQTSKDVKNIAKRLKRYVGKPKKIPSDLKNDVLNLDSNSNIAKIFKQYVRNKK